MGALERVLERPWALACVAFYLRHSPIDRGRWRIKGRALPAARRVLPGRGRRRVRSRRGFPLEVDLDDWGGQFVYLTGEYEEPTARVIEALLAPGDTAVDVGANFGFFTVLAGRSVGPDGRVVAFEPLPSMRRELEVNLGLNGLANCRVRPEAVSDRAGAARLFEGPRGNPGLSSLRPLADSGAPLEVETVALDAALSAEERVALVKIDVEGAELRVLEGMAGLIGRWRPDVVLEVTDRFLREMGASAATLFERARDWGYRSYRIDWPGLFPVERGAEGLPDQFNALLTAREVLPPEVRVAGRPPAA